MEYPHCDSCICNLFCYRKKVFIQSVSNGDHDGISLSGMRAYKSDVYGAARGLCRGMENASVYLWCDYSGGMVWCAEIQRKETKSLGKWVLLLCVGLILYYVYRMVRYFPGDAPMSYYYGSVGYRVWEIIRSGRNYL